MFFVKTYLTVCVCVCVCVGERKRCPASRQDRAQQTASLGAASLFCPGLLLRGLGTLVTPLCTPPLGQGPVNNLSQELSTQALTNTSLFSIPITRTVYECMHFFHILQYAGCCYSRLLVCVLTFPNLFPSFKWNPRKR